jgi:Na+-transporting methylmalonyl-CoA/oxaloacetate decarboxylase gamma subunit
MVGLFCLSLVFLVLAVLYLMVMVLSKVLGLRLHKKTAPPDERAEPANDGQDWDTEAVRASSGELRLIQVDERTAAMIMAIVSDESGIPLSELRFKTIRAIE